ncbi:MAG: hypothetical protein H6741_05745 [Alphaproteobacteria bacterium]|nr:hypothetical protein [Alphaproteobacteria bacterium]MCB9792210.1 hypothetical protein [Alphaproteobacteria bacterium]
MLLKSLFALTIISPFISKDAHAGPEHEAGNPAEITATVSAPAALLYLAAGEAQAGTTENSWNGPTVSAPAALLYAAGEAQAMSTEAWNGPTVSAPAALLYAAGVQEARADFTDHTGETTVSAPAALLYAAGLQEARADFTDHTGETTVRAPAAAPAAALDQGVDPGSPWGHYALGLLLSGVALVAGRRA